MSKLQVREGKSLPALPAPEVQGGIDKFDRAFQWGLRRSRNVFEQIRNRAGKPASNGLVKESRSFKVQSNFS
jgi:hypothetical protein